MRLVKTFFAVLIDSLLMILLTLCITIIASNSLGDFSIHHLFDESDVSKTTLPIIIIVGAVSTLYLFFSRLNNWQTIGRHFVFPNSKYFIKSLSALILDFSFILLLTYAIDFSIKPFIYLQFFYLFAIVIFLHCFISGLIRGKSIGKIFFGIEIKGRNNNLSIIQSLKREVLFKFCLVFLCPWLLFYFIGIIDPFNIFIDVFVLSSIIIIMFFVYKGELWWNKLSNTKKELISIAKPKKTLSYVIVVSIFVALLMFIKYANNKQQDSSNKIWGFNTPLNFPEYPNSYKVNSYADFMALQNTTPKDYILGLFDKFDIVVLCENYHGENTQWELITDIVSDKRFIEKAGNVFTEYGSARHQNKADTFLNTRYESETELEKATASIMEYQSGGFYYFMKNLNKLNNQLPDSLKVKEYFTDIYDWDYLSYIRFFEAGLNQDKRDSLMAQVTIDWYRNNLYEGKRRKCLIITNYRHAFGYPGGVERIKNYFKGNQAQYIFEAFPTKTACVLQNAPTNQSRSLIFPLAMAVNHGIWDKAWQLSNYKPAGFDLKDTPFGLDYFDMYPLLGARAKIFYQDIFTGVIFNKKFNELNEVDYPFKRYAVENEYLQKHPGADTNTIRNAIEQSRWAFVRNEAEIHHSTSLFKQVALANILSLRIVIISGYFSLILLSLNFLIHLLKRSN